MVDELNLLSTTIPAWVVAVLMVYTGIIWLLCRSRNVRAGSKIYAYTLILWGILFWIFQFFIVNVETRGFVARTMLLLICFSQSLPLTVAYLRSFKK
jgi:hypothetical protein